MLLAVQFARFGPYHFTRLRSAVDALGPLGWTVAGFQTASKDATYAWNQNAQADLITVFPDRVYEEIPAGELRRGVAAALDRLRPDAVAIAGWGFPDARACLDWCKKNHARAILMSETRAADGHRVWWKELLKSRIVSRFDAALVGGRSHAEYLVTLGMQRERISFGYDVVDDHYFASKADRIRNLECEPSKARQTAGGSPKGEHASQMGNSADAKEKAEIGEQKAEIKNEERGTKNVSHADVPLSAFSFQPSAFSSPPYFLASNRFIERKNLARLIEAYAKFRQMWNSQFEIRNSQLAGAGASFQTPNSKFKIVPWNLCLLGDGELKQVLMEQCHSLGLAVAECAPWETDQNSTLRIPHSAIVYFPGFRQIDALPEFYARAACFIHPALEEPWGLVLNEAAACGLPILSGNNVGAAEELLCDGVNGWAFDAGNFGAISEVLIKMAALSPEQRHRMGEESFRILHKMAPSKAFGEGLADLLKIERCF